MSEVKWSADADNRVINEYGVTAFDTYVVAGGATETQAFLAAVERCGATQIDDSQKPTYGAKNGVFSSATCYISGQLCDLLASWKLDANTAVVVSSQGLETDPDRYRDLVLGGH